MSNSSNKHLASTRLRCGIVLRVQEEICEIATDDGPLSVRYANQFPSPRTERISPGHLVAMTPRPDGPAAVVWRWYDAVILAERSDLIEMWEPAHGVVLARPRPSYVSMRPGTRAYLSAGLPGADWWVAGPTATESEDADVELTAVENLYTEYSLWDDV